MFVGIAVKLLSNSRIQCDHRRVGDKPDDIWIGPIGRIPIVREDDPQRLAANAASRIAQAAVECDELIDYGGAVGSGTASVRALSG